MRAAYFGDSTENNSSPVIEGFGNLTRPLSRRKREKESEWIKAEEKYSELLFFLRGG